MTDLAAIYQAPGPGPSWTLRRRQLGSIVALESRRILLGRRTLAVYALAFLPVLLMALWATVHLLTTRTGGAGKAGDPAFGFFSVVFQTFVLRFVVFFGCVGIFTNLFRGEVVARTLHYYLLAPVRRELIVAGKFAAGTLATGLIFSVMTIASYLLLYVPEPGALASQFLGGPGLSHLLTYVAIVWLACLGYGAVFLTLGVALRNPVIPAALIFGWEWIHFLLPSALKKISVIHYLYALAPLPLDTGPFALMAEPTSAWIAVPSLVLACAALVALSALLVRRAEIRYGND